MMHLHSLFPWLLVLLLMATEIAAQSLTGTWLGGFRLGDEAQPLLIAFSSERGVPGVATMPAARVNATPVILPANSGRGTRPAFAIVWQGETLAFTVERQTPTFLSGTVSRSTDRGPFELVPVTPLPPELRQQYEGTYVLDDGRRLYLQTLGFAGSVLALCDPSGEFRALQPLSDTTFAVGSGAFLPLPRVANITLGSGRFQRESIEGSILRGRQVAMRRESVRFASGEVTLAGELLLPEAPGPHPCIVSVHGSGPQGRHVLPYSMLLVDHGYAVLGYDKRGVGESSGSWTTASLEDLAGDVVAAVDHLRARSDIRTDAIGLVGGSQAGWINMIAASRTNHIAFVVSISGAATTPAEQELDRVHLEMLADGYDEAEIAEAAGFLRQFNDFLRTGENWQPLELVRARALDRNWIPTYFDVPPSPDHWLVGFWKGMLDYDPVPAMRQVRCPMLALWGGLDLNVPAEKNRVLWDQAIAGGLERTSFLSWQVRHAPDHTSIIYPHGNHLLLEARSGQLAEWPQLTRFVPGFLDTLVRWLDEHVKS